MAETTDVFQLLGTSSRATPRTEQLRALVASLSLQEARELSKMLSEIDFRVDIPSNVPAELRLLIANHLDMAGFLAALSVSKGWREMWLQESMIKVLAHRLIPGFVEYYDLKKATTTMQPLPQEFARAARRRLIRQSGKFQSCITYSLLHPTVDSPFEFASEKCKEEFETFTADFDGGRMGFYFATRYNNGRFAWKTDRPDDPRVVVDDLRTQRRKVYSWHLATDRVDSIQMFHGDGPWMGEITAVGNRVAIRNSLTEYTIWTFTRGSTTVDTSPYCQRDLPEGVRNAAEIDRRIILHPLLENVYFLVFKKWPLPTAIIVYEFTNGLLSGTYKGSSANRKFHRGFLDRYYSTTEEPLIAELGDAVSPELYGDFKYVHDPGEEANYGTHHFNIYTKAFSERQYRIPDTNYSRCKISTWGGQLTYWLEDTAEEQDKYGPLYLGTGPLLGYFDSTDSPPLGRDYDLPVFLFEASTSPGESITRCRTRYIGYEEEKMLKLPPRSNETVVDGEDVAPSGYIPGNPKYYLLPRDYANGPTGQEYKAIWQDEEFLVVEYGHHLSIFSFFTDMVTKREPWDILTSGLLG
ncbi:hypothetical protein OQA88_12248 [Cercophora sp. LCS_1]